METLGRKVRSAYSLYGRTFEIGNAIEICATLLDDIEADRLALGFLDPSEVPRHYCNGT